MDRSRAEQVVLDTVTQNRRRPVREIVDALFELTSVGESSPLGDDRTALVLRR
jgi:hypothetical protein